jgi:RNA polymerase sigma-70 factor (ECF subfamily)
MPLLSLLGRMGDADAVAKTLRGEPDGIATLYEGHAEVLHRLIYRLTGSVQDSEDILHDLFVALPELLRRYEDHGQLRGWLRQVAARMTLMRIRKDRRRSEVSLDTLVNNPAIETAPVFNDAFLIERAISALPEPQRTVFVLRQLEGYSYDEIAQLLQITPGTARVRYLRALRRVRQQLEGS